MRIRFFHTERKSYIDPSPGLFRIARERICMREENYYADYEIVPNTLILHDGKYEILRWSLGNRFKIEGLVSSSKQTYYFEVCDVKK